MKIIAVILTFSLFDWHCYVSTITKDCAMQLELLKSWYGCNIRIRPAQYLNGREFMYKNTTIGISVSECIGVDDTDWEQKACILRDVSYLLLRSKECCKTYHSGVQKVYFIVDDANIERMRISRNEIIIDSIDVNDINSFEPCKGYYKRPFPEVPKSLAR